MAISAKYFITDQRGNYIDWSARISGFSLLGKEVQLIGGAGDDALYVQAGTSADISNMGGGVNTLYLTGNLADYTQTIDQQTGVYTFTRTAGLAGGQSEVVKFTVGDKNDVVYFADGHLTVNAASDIRLFDGTAFQNIQAGWLTVGGSPASPVTTAATTATTPTKVFIVDAQGLDVPMLMQPGQAMEITGSGAVDTVYINAGTSANASNLGGGNDRLYFQGNLADYAQTIDQQTGVYTFARSVGGQNETVQFTVSDQDDVVYFADGYITINAATDIRLHNGTAFQTIQGGWLTSSPAIVDTAFNLLQGGWGVLPSITPGVAVEVTDAITVAELALIDAANGWGSLIYSSLVDTQANLSASSYVKSGVNVTVTDAATIAQLSAFNVANGTASVTASSITDTATNLVSGGVVSPFVTSGVAVAVTDSISLVDLAALDLANGAGALSYVGVRGTLSELNTSMAANGYLDPNNPAAVGVAIVVSNTVSMVDLFNFEVNTGVAPIATTIADTAANLSGYSQYITSGVNVTVTDVITVAGLTLIDAANGAGTLSYSLADTQANLSASTYVNAGVAVTVTDDATIAQLSAFNAANGAAIVTATSITDTASNLAPGGVVSPFITSGVAVNVTGTIPLTDLAAIDVANGAGALAYAGVSGTLSAINASVGASGYVAAGVAVTVTDAVSLADLSGIQAVTGVQPVATSIADLAANLISAGVASAYIASGVAVEVTGSISIDDLVLIDAANGAASVTVSAITDVAAKLVTGGVASPYINTGVAVNVTDTISIADLAAIDAANGTAGLTYAGITGTLSQVTPYVANGVTVTVTDTVTVQNLADIQAISNIKPIVSSVADTAANLKLDGLGGSTNYVTDGVAVAVTDTISIADLVTIDTTNGGGGVTVVSLTDTAAQLLAARTTYITGGVAVTVTDAITISDLTLLDNANNGTAGVTLTSLADTAANLAPGGVPSAYIAAGVPVAVTDSIALTTLSAIDSANGSAAVSYAGIANTSGTSGSADVLQLSSAFNALDFGGFNQAGQAALLGFEIFDMATDTGVNAITLTKDAMFLQASNLSNATAEQVLTVNGGANDSVTLLAGGFASQGAANGFNADGSAGTGYSKYVASYVDGSSVSHLLEVLIQNGVAVL